MTANIYIYIYTFVLQHADPNIFWNANHILSHLQFFIIADEENDLRLKPTLNVYIPNNKHSTKRPTRMGRVPALFQY
jgi:hypothetical protein